MATTNVRGGQIKDASVDLTVDVTGTLPVANGGTGGASQTLNNVLLGNGTGALQNVAPGAAGNLLKSDGTTWVSGVIDTFMGESFDTAQLGRDVILTASTDFAVDDALEVPAAYVLEIPATTSLEVLCYVTNSFAKAIADTEIAATPSRTLGSLMCPSDKSLYPSSDLTLTLTTVSPSYTGMLSVTRLQTNHFRAGGLLYDNGSQSWNYINGMTNGIAAYTSYEIEFWMFGTDMAIQTSNSGQQDYMVIVDDQPATKLWSQFPATVAVYYIKLQFATAGYHKVRILMGDNGLGGFLMPSTGALWPAQPRFKVAIIGDSDITGPSSTSDGAILAGNVCGELARLTGWEIWNLGQGSTGYSNDGGGTNGISKYGSASRMAALAALPPMDLMMCWGGGDDNPFSTWPEAAALANANACWNAMKAARPNTPLIVAGIESLAPTGWNLADMTTYNNDLRTLAMSNPNVLAFIDMRGVPGISSWINGTGKQGTPVGDGNADFFVSSDGVHYSHAGFDYIAQRTVDFLRPIKI